jgi:hypothetical protein
MWSVVGKALLLNAAIVGMKLGLLDALFILLATDVIASLICRRLGW